MLVRLVTYVSIKYTFFFALNAAACNEMSVSEAWFDAEEYLDGRWAINGMIAQSQKCDYGSAFDEVRNK